MIVYSSELGFFEYLKSTFSVHIGAFFILASFWMVGRIIYFLVVPHAPIVSVSDLEIKMNSMLFFPFLNNFSRQLSDVSEVTTSQGPTSGAVNIKCNTGFDFTIITTLLDTNAVDLADVIREKLNDSAISTKVS